MLTQRTTLLAVVFAVVAALLFLASVLLPTYKSRSLQTALRAARLLGVWCCGLGLATVIVDDSGSHVTSILLLAGWATATVAVVVSARYDIYLRLRRPSPVACDARQTTARLTGVCAHAVPMRLSQIVCHHAGPSSLQQVSAMR